MICPICSPAEIDCPICAFRFPTCPSIGGFHFQVFQTLTNQCQAPFHITYILVKTAYLTFPKNMILPDTFVNNSQLLFGCYIFFLCLAIVFTCYQLFVYQTFILLITALLPDKALYSGRYVLVSVAVVPAPY